ncbi:DUF1281 family ferredoxin-like fold protein [Mucilaginibacter sp. HD30]
MANWCSNKVEFIGEHSQFESLKTLFTAMAVKENKEKRGQLPEFVTGEGGFLFQIAWENGLLYYETKWVPNTAVIVKIAEFFKVDFIHSYSESSNAVFGEASYCNGMLNDISLDRSDTELYHFNYSTDSYVFEGQEYESSDDILEILLNRKKQAHISVDAVQNTSKSDN